MAPRGSAASVGDGAAIAGKAKAKKKKKEVAKEGAVTDDDEDDYDRDYDRDSRGGRDEEDEAEEVARMPLEEYLNYVGNYKPGSIREIRLTNFLSYRSVVIRPGPRYEGNGGNGSFCARLQLVLSPPHPIILLSCPL
jgi:hypothetical protein